MKTSYLKDGEIPVPAGLENRLEQLIDRLDTQEKQSKRRRIPIWVGSIAAGIAVLITVSVFFHANYSQRASLAANRKSMENPELAYMEVEKALGRVSVNFNKGLNQLDLMSENLEKTNKILEKTFHKQ